MKSLRVLVSVVGEVDPGGPAVVHSVLGVRAAWACVGRREGRHRHLLGWADAAFSL
jgi:hypothetical protein